MEQAGRINTHEQVCAERYKALDEKLTRIFTKLEAITPLRLISCLVLIVGLMATVLKLFG